MGAHSTWMRRSDFVEEVLDVGTTAGVDGDAFAAGDVADDFFTADGITTAGAIDEEVVLALDLERVRPFAEEDAFDGVGHVGEGVSDDAGLGAGLGFGGDGRAGFELVEDLARGDLAEAFAGEEFGLGGEAVLGGDLVVVGFVVLGERHFVLAGFAVEELLADLDGALALMLVDPMLDLVAGAGGLAVFSVSPVAGGGVSGLGSILDDVAVAELGAEGDDASVDLRADGGVADLGVDGVGEVDGAGVPGQDDDFSLGSEGVDLFGVQVDFEGRHELVGVGHFALPLHELADPG